MTTRDIDTRKERRTVNIVVALLIIALLPVITTAFLYGLLRQAWGAGLNMHDDLRQWMERGSD